MKSYEFVHDHWHGGQLMGFSAIDGQTDYHDALSLRTSFEAPGLDVMLPSRCRVRFPSVKETRYALAGDWLTLLGDPSNHVVLLDAHHLLIEGPCTVSDVASGLCVREDQNRTLIGAAEHFDETRIETNVAEAIRERKAWLSTLLPSAPVRSDGARRTLAKALSMMKTQVFSPSGQIHHRWTTPDRWPHRGMWLWDSAFHAIGWRHLDLDIAKESLLAIINAQQENGFIPHCVTPDSSSSVTQPPVLAFGAQLVYEKSGDVDWIRQLYPSTAAYLEWDIQHRDIDGKGLLGWHIEGDPHCRSGESGMDNSPRFDKTTSLCAVDFNAYLSLECEIMSQWAQQLGYVDDALLWRQRHDDINQRIRSSFWSVGDAFFVDIDAASGQHSPVLASSGFLPLICGAASAEQAAQLAEHLKDPTRFGTRFPVPSIASRDTQHYAKDMWRGPVWINMNWLLVQGLKRYGFDELAETLRITTMRTIEHYFERYGVLFEFYDDRGEVDPPKMLRKGKCAPEEHPYHQVVHDFGWTATLYVDFTFNQTGETHLFQKRA